MPKARLINALSLSLVFLLCSTWGPASAEQSAGRRIALVIGNGAYRSVDRLANPINDARLMAETLQKLGFALVGDGPQIDLNKTRFDRLVQQFGKAIPGAEVALFYYSGHGMQVQGENWLVPVDANPTSSKDLDFQMVDAGLVLRQMEDAGTKLNLVVLDACRNNPLASRGVRASGGGLAEMRAPEGTMISYATQPGSVAFDGTTGNSPYTAALVAAMQLPNLDVFHVFNQVGLTVKQSTGGAQQPWLASSPITGNFYFNTGPVTIVNPTDAAPTVATGSVGAELLFWQSIMTSKVAADYAAYLERFPTGVFASLAKNRIADLTAIDKDGLVAQFVARHTDFQHAAHVADFYISRPDHRAIAISVDAYFLRTARPSLRDAEDLALEGCQIWAKKACSLLAAEARWTSSDERGTPRAMPRVSYQGIFDPAMIPIVDDTVRNRADVTGYRAAVGPKAAALLPSWGVFVVARASSQHSAEETALSQCNNDPTHNDMRGPCFLYAVDDQVVLAQGLTQATPER